MKNKFYNICMFFLLSLFMIIQGCTDEPLPSLYETVTTGKPTPVINSITPGEAIAVVTPITISGTNFSSVPEENFVYFNGTPGKIVSASATEITVISPNVISDSVRVKVRVTGAEQFSPIVNYKLTPALFEVLDPEGKPIFSTTVKATAITLDNLDNVYFSQTSLGIKKVTPAGEVSNFAPKGGETVWFGMKWGGDATIYGARSSRGVWKITEGAAAPNQPWTLFTSGNLIDLDVASDKSVWGIGANTIFYAPPEGGSGKTFSFEGIFRSIRVYDNAIYIAGTRTGIEGVWRFPLTAADNIGDAELYYDYANFDEASDVKINAITFAADGDLYLGTTRVKDPIVVVHPDKSANVLYEGAIAENTEVLYFSWDTGNFLYFVRKEFGDPSKDGLSQAVLRINMEKHGAPYFGRM